MHGLAINVVSSKIHRHQNTANVTIFNHGKIAGIMYSWSAGIRYAHEFVNPQYTPTSGEMQRAKASNYREGWVGDSIGSVLSAGPCPGNGNHMRSGSSFHI